MYEGLEYKINSSISKLNIPLQNKFINIKIDIFLYYWNVTEYKLFCFPSIILSFLSQRIKT